MYWRFDGQWLNLRIKYSRKIRNLKYFINLETQHYKSKQKYQILKFLKYLFIVALNIFFSILIESVCSKLKKNNICKTEHEQLVKKNSVFISENICCYLLTKRISNQFYLLEKPIKWDETINYNDFIRTIKRFCMFTRNRKGTKLQGKKYIINVRSYTFFSAMITSFVTCMNHK